MGVSYRASGWSEGRAVDMAQANMKPRICLVVTSDVTVRAFLLDHLRALSQDFDITVVTSTPDGGWLRDEGIPVRLVCLRMERNPAPSRDITSLVRLTRFLSDERFELLHSLTPKAGLLVGIASRLAAAGPKIHTFTGQVWATRHGLARRLLKICDRIIVITSRGVLADSPSQARFLREEGIAHEMEVTVFGRGSFTGVSVSRFDRNPTRRCEARRALGIPENALAVVFLGRLKRAKGVLDLAAAAAGLADSGLLFHLVVAGPDEEELEQRVRELASSLGDRLHVVGFTPHPEEILAAADVLCLPSYREGFPSVVIEAAVGGIPTLASRIPGVVDAIEEGSTGLLHDMGNVSDIRRGLERLLRDPALRAMLGENARKRAVAWFSREASIAAWRSYYQTILFRVP